MEAETGSRQTVSANLFQPSILCGLEAGLKSPGAAGFLGESSRLAKCGTAVYGRHPASPAEARRIVGLRSAPAASGASGAASAGYDPGPLTHGTLTKWRSRCTGGEYTSDEASATTAVATPSPLSFQLIIVSQR